MAAPKQRKTKSRKGQRRMHIYIPHKQLMKCPQCGKKKLPHRVCSFCGYYNGREVIDVLEDLKPESNK